MKTAELTGTALDWAVAKCEGFCLNLRITIDGEEQWAFHPYSTVWNHGGPILEREKISDSWQGAVWEAVSEEFGTLRSIAVEIGPTRLIAGMRCYVASKLGDEIDIPDELL